MNINCDAHKMTTKRSQGDKYYMSDTHTKWNIVNSVLGVEQVYNAKYEYTFWRIWNKVNSLNK